MEVKNLWPDRLLEGVNFNIYAGEILGLAGQLGSGTGDILAAIAGSTRTRGGELIYKGKTFLPKSPKEAINSGIAYCSDDRKHDGLFLGRPISENLSSAALKSISKNGIRLPKSENEMVTENAIKFTIVKDEKSMDNEEQKQAAIQCSIDNQDDCEMCGS